MDARRRRPVRLAPVRPPGSWGRSRHGFPDPLPPSEQSRDRRFDGPGAFLPATRVGLARKDVVPRAYSGEREPRPPHRLKHRSGVIEREDGNDEWRLALRDAAMSAHGSRSTFVKIGATGVTCRDYFSREAKVVSNEPWPRRGPGDLQRPPRQSVGLGISAVEVVRVDLRPEKSRPDGALSARLRREARIMPTSPDDVGRENDIQENTPAVNGRDGFRIGACSRPRPTQR